MFSIPLFLQCIGLVATAFKPVLLLASAFLVFFSTVRIIKITMKV